MDNRLCPCGTRYIDPPSKNRSCAKPYLHVGLEGLRTANGSSVICTSGSHHFCRVPVCGCECHTSDDGNSGDES